MALRRDFPVIDEAPFTLPEPFGTLPLLLDAERMDDARHVQEVALEIVKRAGTKDGAHMSIDFTLWKGLLTEQCTRAKGLNPFTDGHEFRAQWEFVICGLIDANVATVDLETRSVIVSNLDQWLFDMRERAGTGF